MAGENICFCDNDLAASLFHVLPRTKYMASTNLRKSKTKIAKR